MRLSTVLLAAAITGSLLPRPVLGQNGLSRVGAFVVYEAPNRQEDRLTRSATTSARLKRDSTQWVGVQVQCWWGNNGHYALVLPATVAGTGSVVTGSISLPGRSPFTGPWTLDRKTATFRGPDDRFTDFVLGLLDAPAGATANVQVRAADGHELTLAVPLTGAGRALESLPCTNFGG